LTFKAWPAQRAGAHRTAKLSRKQVSFGLRQLRHSTMRRKRRRISAKAQGAAQLIAATQTTVVARWS
jgi:hypothetical protein